MSRLAILASAVTVAVLASAAPSHADATVRPRTATHYRTLEKMLHRFSRQASASRPAAYAAR